jgi:hypothetical protein
MPSQEQEVAVTTDLMDVFRERYGESPYLYYTKNLTPSPLQEIATRNNVSLHFVRKCRSTLMHIGLFMNAVMENNPNLLVE